MKVIYKDEVPIREGRDVTVNLRKGSYIISCGFQGDVLCIWYECDPSEMQHKSRLIFVCRTGEPLPETQTRFIGTACDYSDPSFPFVVHLFELASHAR